VELIVIAQAQHINNGKYNKSYKINDECRQTIVDRFCNVKEISISLRVIKCAVLKKLQ
jgi:hypothetical protein